MRNKVCPRCGNVNCPCGCMGNPLYCYCPVQRNPDINELRAEMASLFATNPDEEVSLEDVAAMEDFLNMEMDSLLAQNPSFPAYQHPHEYCPCGCDGDLTICDYSPNPTEINCPECDGIWEHTFDCTIWD